MFTDNEEREAILKMLNARCLNQYIIESELPFFQIVLCGPAFNNEMIEGINVRYIRMCVKHYLTFTDGRKGNTIRVVAR